MITATDWAIACPPAPPGAISFVEREAAAYDEAAVQARQAQKRAPHGCPGMRAMRQLHPEDSPRRIGGSRQPPLSCGSGRVQIKLAPVHAPYFAGREAV